MKTINILTAIRFTVGMWIGNASAGSKGTSNTFYGANAGTNTTIDDSGQTRLARATDVGCSHGTTSDAEQVTRNEYKEKDYGYLRTERTVRRE